jgi:hypothetical protein
MSPIQLPRPVEDYFAFAELPPTRQGRRFTITFPYFDGERLDRLQWWFRISATEERIGGDAALASLRAEAVLRFRTHIERWLANSGRALTDGEPFPRLLVPADVEEGDADEAGAGSAAAAVPPDNVIGWPSGKVANG